MDVLRQRLHVIDRRRRQNAVTEIEDVPGASVCPFEHVVGAVQHAIERRQQKRRIEIALYRVVVADAIPGFVQSVFASRRQ